jgi:hypothetical protein
MYLWSLTLMPSRLILGPYIADIIWRSPKVKSLSPITYLPIRIEYSRKISDEADNALRYQFHAQPILFYSRTLRILE